MAALMGLVTNRSMKGLTIPVYASIQNPTHGLYAQHTVPHQNSYEISGRSDENPTVFFFFLGAIATDPDPASSK